MSKGTFTRLALGIEAGEESRATRAIDAGLHRSDLEERVDAATAATILKWPALVEPLEGALARATQDEERRVLEHALGECKRAPTQLS